MKDAHKTKAQLIAELQNLRRACEAAGQLSAAQTPGAEVFHKIVENAHDAIISINRNGVIVFANRKAEEMFGYTAGALIGKLSAELIPHESRDAEEQAVSRHRLNVPGGLLTTLKEGIVLRKDGTRLPVEASYYGYQVKGAYVMTGIVRDIRERHKIEKELAEARDFLKNLFDVGLDGLIVSDAQGIITMVNDSAVEMLAYAREDLIGKHFGDLGITPVPDKGHAEALIKGFLSHGKLLCVERTWKRGDGTLVDVEMNISSIKDAAGNMIGAMASLRDISLRKKAETALRLSEERYRRIFENSFVALQEVDISRFMTCINDLKAAGIRDFRHYCNEHPDFVWQAINMAHVIDVNDAMLRMYGAQNKEALRASAQEFFGGESPAFREGLIALAEGKSAFQAESVHHTLHGGDINVLLQINVLAKQRDLHRILISIIDITQVKSAEKKLVEYQQQLRSLTNELISKEENERRKLGVYLHDRIGQSLSAIKMHLEMMAAELTGSDDREKCSRILKQIEETIHDTRVLSYELSPVILHELGLEVALGWLADQTRKQHNVAVSFTSDKHAGQLDDDIKIILYRAVSELLSNVVKHAWAKRATVSIKRRQGQVHITVEDDGVGFDPVELEGVAATERGFGLFSIKERLHYLKGSITVTSAPYQGTCIMLSVPLP
jgi:PAS domain S-box-containing protein